MRILLPLLKGTYTVYAMNINLRKLVFFVYSFSVQKVPNDTQTNSRNEIGGWEKHTKGIGAKLLLKVSNNLLELKAKDL